MIRNFLLALMYIYIIWCTGQCIISLTQYSKAHKYICWLSFSVGFSILILLSTFCYFTCKLPVDIIRLIWLGLGCISTFLLIKKRQIGKRELQVFLLVLTLFLFLLVPGILRKDQYYVYRGNCTDQQTYMEETVAISLHPISWYENHTEDEIAIESDVLLRGYKWMTSDRPSAGLMIAILCETGIGEIYFIAYLYRMFVQALIAPALIYLFYVLFNCIDKHTKIQKLCWFTVATLYCIGFWGQIQYDIDAVSQMSCIAVLISLTAIFLQYITNPIHNINEEAFYLVSMILLASAGLIIYLENALIHGALYLITILTMILWGKIKVKKEHLCLTIVPPAAFGILLFTNYRIMHFFTGQIGTSMSDTRQSWASYFNAWQLGKYGISSNTILSPISKFSNYVVSTFGMYNITVNYSTYSGKRAILLTSLVAIVAILIILTFFRFFFKKTGIVINSFWILTLVGIFIMLCMVALQKPWSAGKLLYYISPYLYTFLCIPVLHLCSKKDFTEKLAFCTAIILLLANTKMVFERAYDIKVNYACTGFRGNYPSDMIGGLKPMVIFDFDTTELENVDGVIIDDLSILSDYQFYLQYLKTKLTHAHIPFYVINDTDYYQNPLEISNQRTLQGTVKKLSLSQNNDGRYTIQFINHTID